MAITGQIAIELKADQVLSDATTRTSDDVGAEFMTLLIPASLDYGDRQQFVGIFQSVFNVYLNFYADFVSTNNVIISCPLASAGDEAAMTITEQTDADYTAVAGEIALIVSKTFVEGQRVETTHFHEATFKLLIAKFLELSQAN